MLRIWFDFGGVWLGLVSPGAMDAGVGPGRYAVLSIVRLGLSGMGAAAISMAGGMLLD